VAGRRGTGSATGGAGLVCGLGLGYLGAAPQQAVAADVLTLGIYWHVVESRVSELFRGYSVGRRKPLNADPR